jgi:hypothetical protein
MGRRVMHIGYWWESQKERGHLEDQNIGRWIGLIWLRIGTSGRLLGTR